jgi:GH24 family phage-related lysozyme (muramidase)
MTRKTLGGIGLATAMLLLSSVDLFSGEQPTQPSNEKTISKVYIPPEEDLVKTLTMDEGRRNWVYDDATGKRLYPGQQPKGKRTIGVGFNLERAEAKQKIEEIGLNYADVKYGKKEIADWQIDKLRNDDIATAKKDARNYIGERFDSLPKGVQDILTNMAFNMGYGGLSGFTKLREAVNRGDYNRAAQEMENSKWYSQTGDRSKRLVKKMRSYAP